MIEIKRIKNLLFSICFFHFILGCGNGSGNPQKPSPLPPDSSHSFGLGDSQGNFHKNLKFFRQLLDEETIEEKTFITKVLPGDRVYLVIQGWKIRPQFVVHTKEMTIDRGEGKCEFNYRRQIEDLKEPLWEKNPSHYPLYLVIGGKKYLLNNVRQNGFTLYSDLTVTQRMLEKGNELYLDLQKAPTSGEVRVGFIDDGDCPKAGGDTSPLLEEERKFKKIEDRLSYEFKVSVTLGF